MPSQNLSHVPPSFGPLLRKWRQARGLSQERLAVGAEISTRHLSFLENRNAAPSREMVLILANALDLPLRERNAMLASAGFAAVYHESTLDGAAMAPIRRALDHLLRAHEPYGAVVVDRLWNLRSANTGATRMLAALLPSPIDPFVAGNVLRVFFHPAGLRAIIVDWEEAASMFLERIHRDAAMYPEDHELRALLDEVLGYPGVPATLRAPGHAPIAPVLSVHIRHDGLDLKLFTTITTLGTPLDVTAQELRIESYFPADDITDRWIRGLTG